MKNFFSVIIVFLIFILISSCNNCKYPACPKLSTEEASWFPYSVNDTLVFKSKISDSILLLPISFNENGSNLFTPSNGDECNKYCVAGKNIYSYYVLNNIKLFSSIFIVERISEDFYVIISPKTIPMASSFKIESYFDLRHTNKLDTISINGELLEDVYHYTCYPAQEEVSETYVKKGMGLVKIVFRNGQEFELMEHRKAK